MSLPTAQAFRTRAERMIRDANPGLPDDVVFDWEFSSRPYPLRGVTGTGRSGRVRIFAGSGFRSKVMHASVESNGSMMVR
jgi:hypothetical protein